LNNSENIRFGTVGSPQTTPGSGTIAAIEHIRQLGLAHLEIAWVRSVRVSDKTCAEIKATAEEHDVTLSIHAPYYINLNSQTDDLMRKSDERLLSAARKGQLAGARDIVFHPGSYHNQPAEQVYDRVCEKLGELSAILRDEVRHSRLGWAHLAFTATRRDVSWLAPWVPAMLAGATEAETLPFEPSATDRGELVRWGILPPRDVARITRAAVHSAILPGLRRHGIEASYPSHAGHAPAPSISPRTISTRQPKKMQQPLTQ